MNGPSRRHLADKTGIKVRSAYGLVWMEEQLIDMIHMCLQLVEDPQIDLICVIQI